MNSDFYKNPIIKLLNNQFRLLSNNLKSIVHSI